MNKPHTEESKRKISDSKKGTSPWNKGKKGLQVAWNKGTKGIMTAWNKGKVGVMPIPWNKGLKDWRVGYKHSEETKKKIGAANSISHKGLHRSEETKRKIGLNGFHYGMREKKVSEETKSKLREYSVNNPNRKFKDTGIELRVEAELQRRKINYQKQVPLCKVAIVDFYLPEYRIVIQCDGDYWHNRKGSKERDLGQDSVLTFNGFNVYRFWEHEINESVENCINSIKLWLTD